MKIYYWHLIVGICLIIIIYLSSYIFSNKLLIENFGEKQNTLSNIIFLGDSILNNSAFLPNQQTVFNQMKQALSPNTDLISFAKNGAIMSNMSFQISQLPVYLDNSKTSIFISIGGNDLLQSQTPKQLIKQHTDHIKNIKIHMPTSHIYILNLYSPVERKYDSFIPTIQDWNNKLHTQYYNKSKNIHIIDINSSVTRSGDFIQGIEPSAEGGKKIVDVMLKSVTN
jgi:lysophospholipase L1-like esterase